MANRIKGITVEIGGDTTKLSKALEGVNKNIKNTQTQLKDVQKLLKLDPTNTELLSQKHKLLADAVTATKEKLETLKTAAALAGDVKFCGDAFGEIEIATTNTDGSMRELNDILADCRVAFAQMSESEQASAAQALVGKNAMSGFLALMNAAPADIQKLEGAISTCSDEIDGYNGVTEKMAAVMQDNLGGQLTILKSQLQELAISFGEILMPAIRTIVSRIQGLIDKFNAMSPATKETIVKIALVAATLGPLLVGVGKLMQLVANLPTIIASAKAAFTSFGAAIGGTSAPVVAVIAVVAALVAAFVHLWRTNEDFRNKITAIWEQIKNIFSGFCQGIVDRVNALGFDFKNIGEVIKAVWDGLCKFLAPVFEGVFQQVANIFKAVTDIILNILDIFVGIFTGDWSRVWDGIVTAVWTALKNLIKTGQLDIKSVVTTTWEAVSGVVRTAVNAIKTVVQAVWDAMPDTVRSAMNRVKEAVLSIWDGIKNGIGDRLGGVRDAVVNAMNAVYDAVMDKVNSSWSWGRDLMQNLINGITYMLGSLINTVADVARSIWEYLHLSVPEKGALTDVEEWMPDFMKGLAKGINKSRKYVEAAVSGVADAMTLTMQSGLNVDMDGISGAMMNGGSGGVVNNYYNNDNSRTVNQTNNSPKSLSRLEIYRMTRNALNV